MGKNKHAQAASDAAEKQGPIGGEVLQNAEETQIEKKDAGEAEAAADTHETSATTAAVNPDVDPQHDETHSGANPPGDAQGASGAPASDGGVSSSPEVSDQAATEDEAQLADHEGSVIYEDEWSICLTMAFNGQGRDVLTDWGNVPFVMAQFILDNPDAPDEAVLMQVKLKEKIVVLPNEDQRRVLLAVKLFSAYVLGWHAIDRADGEARRIAVAEAEYLARPREKLDLTDTAYELVDGPFDQTSDLAKAAHARAAQNANLGRVADA